MFFKSVTVHLHKLTRVYAGQYFAYFLSMLSKSYVGNVGNLELPFKSRGLLARAPISGAISLYITNLKSYLGFRNNCLQLPTNS
jgi:hypothetical protein